MYESEDIDLMFFSRFFRFQALHFVKSRYLLIRRP